MPASCRTVHFTALLAPLVLSACGQHPLVGALWRSEGWHHGRAEAGTFWYRGAYRRYRALSPRAHDPWHPLRDALPNPSLTPGALNPAVTQANIHETICVRGYSRAIRPPENYTERLKRAQIRKYGYRDRWLRDYEEDHEVPLEAGGSPTSPENLWPEPYDVAGGWGAHAKDRLENRLNHLVCRGRLSLAAAQHAIATNWIAAYRKYVGATR